MNHPRLLAFGYTYLPQGSTERSYDVISRKNLEDFQSATQSLTDVRLVDVHHTADYDGATITDVIWKEDTHPQPYTDVCANNSWVFADLDRIAHGE